MKIVSRSLAVLAIVLTIGLLSAKAVEVHLADGSLLNQNSPSPDGRVPVLFVHGHNPNNEATDPNFENDWQESLNGLPSFKQTLDAPANSGLSIEQYYIRFLDQSHSITEDARDISDAIELILHRHDPDYPAHATSVRVVIIAFSKGTISSRQYLKSLEVQVAGMPAPRPAFHPISDFIAISPPNHGITATFFALTTQLSVKQLFNGFHPDGVVFHCDDSFGVAAATNYIAVLNGHPMSDTATSAAQTFASEAPNSRADGSPPNSGALYVTLFADNNRDMVGGATPGSECNPADGRRLAKNLSPDAINLEVSQVPGTEKLTVHQNTVHTPEAICLALFTATHHRAPPANLSCQSAVGPAGLNVPVIPAPGRAAAMLTLDFSGSMNAPACPTCGTRADVLKDAIDLFVHLWSIVGAPGDRLGVNYFSTNVTPFSFNGQTLPLLRDDANAVTTDVRAQNASGMTAIGGGLQRSVEALSDPVVDANVRRVLLFTDGMQNVNPMVTSLGSTYEISNQPNHPNSNVTPTGMRLDQLGNISIDTIGIGAGPTFTALLSDIATDTNGRSWVTTAPDDDLRQFFIEQLINALRGFSPELIDYRHASMQSHSAIQLFNVEAGGHRLVFNLNWKRGDHFDYVVTRNGVDVSSLGRFVNGPFYKFFVIDLPAKTKAGTMITSLGTWRLRIAGERTTSYEAAAIVDGSPISYNALFSTRRAKVGDAVDLIVRFSVRKRPLSHPQIIAVINQPQESVTDVITRKELKPGPALEPNLSIEDRRLIGLAQGPNSPGALKHDQRRLVLRELRNNEHRTTFRPEVPGVYTARVTIQGRDAKFGKFTRTMTITTVVRERGAR